MNNPGNSFTGNGSLLTSLSAANLTTGTIADQRLAANVARLDGANAFTGSFAVSSSGGTFSIVNEGGVVPGLWMNGGPSPGFLRMRNALEIWPSNPSTQGASGPRLGTLDVRDQNGNPTIYLDGGTGTLSAGTITASIIGNSTFNVAEHEPANRGVKVRFGHNNPEFLGMSVLVNPGTAGCGNSGDLLFNTWECNTSASREVMRINGRGRMGLGTTGPSARLHVKQAVDNAGFNPVNDGIRLEAASGEYWGIQTQAGGDLVFGSGLGSGYAYISKNSGQFNITSDAWFKKRVEAMGPTLERVLKLRPVTFQYKKSPDDSPAIVGFIAQEVQPLFPEVVNVKDGYMAIAYESFGPIAIRAIQDLDEKLDRQSAVMAEKDEQIRVLERRWAGKLEQHAAELGEMDNQIQSLTQGLAEVEVRQARLLAGEGAREARLLAIERALGVTTASLKAGATPRGAQ